MSDTDCKNFVKAFLRFIDQQKQSGRFGEDQKESLEVALQCLENVFFSDEAEADKKADPAGEVDLFELYRASVIQVTPERKEEAENLKNEGNRLMKDQKFQEALNVYNQAVALDATNPVFYCNRAAAYNRLGDYNRAVEDCKLALKYDENYSKAYGRLGVAYSKINKNEEAVAAYKRALEIEPDNEDYKNNLEVAQKKIESAPRSGAGPSFGGFPGFDITAALNNPALIQMASRMMTDPSMQTMLSQMSDMSDVNSLVETGRQLAQQIAGQNPELVESIRRQMQDGGFPGNNEENPQQPPPQP